MKKIKKKFLKSNKPILEEPSRPTSDLTSPVASFLARLSTSCRSTCKTKFEFCWYPYCCLKACTPPSFQITHWQWFLTPEFLKTSKTNFSFKQLLWTHFGTEEETECKLNVNIVFEFVCGDKARQISFGSGWIAVFGIIAQMPPGPRCRANASIWWRATRR